MFDNEMFEKWLDSQSQKIVEKLGRGEGLRMEEMIVLVLRSQAKRFHYSDRNRRDETKIS